MTYTYLLVYFGLRRRAEWVIPLLQLTLALMCLRCFLTVMDPETDRRLILYKTPIALLVLFLAQQLTFFSRREVRAFFGAEGLLLFRLSQRVRKTILSPQGVAIIAEAIDQSEPVQTCPALFAEGDSCRTSSGSCNTPISPTTSWVAWSPSS